MVKTEFETSTDRSTQHSLPGVPLVTKLRSGMDELMVKLYAHAEGVADTGNALSIGLLAGGTAYRLSPDSLYSLDVGVMAFGLTWLYYHGKGLMNQDRQVAPPSSFSLN